MPVRAAATRRQPVQARWTVRAAAPDLCQLLARELSIHPAVARVLAGRGWTDPAQCAAFLTPKLASLRDPFELRDMDRAAARLLEAIHTHEPIAIWGDYDVDGVTSTALLVLTLRFLGAQPRTFLPHRVNDGYGLSQEPLRVLAAEGTRLLVTVDCGISGMEEVALARTLGMDVIITDHHLIGEDRPLPDAHAIVNPNRPDALYDGAPLCGVGTAFKLAHALLKRSGRDATECRAFLMSLLDLVALGTIADVVPLEGENRILAKAGLETLFRTKRPGLRALLHVSGFQGLRILSDHVGFMLAPRINAAGRTEHANLALELLLTEDSRRAEQLASHLHSLNQHRQAEEKRILADAIRQADAQMETDEDSFLITAGPDYHVGVVGIVAARIAERYHRPSLVLRREPEHLKGSGRSIPGFDLYEALSCCSAHIHQFGGHSAAAGLTILPASLAPLRAAANDHARAIFEKEDLAPEVLIDARVELAEMGWDLYNDVQRLQPYGEGNPAPAFLIQGATCPPNGARIVGKDHLKFRVRSADIAWNAIAWRMAHLLPVVESQTRPFDLVFRPTENTFRGETTLELEVLDLRPSA